MSCVKLTNGKAREAREDVDLLKLALSQMWPIDDEAKKAIVDRQVEIVKDPFVPTVVRTMAAKNLIAMGLLNLKSIELLVKNSGVPSQQVQPMPMIPDEELAIGAQLLLEKAPEPAAPVESPRIISEESEYEVA